MRLETIPISSKASMVSIEVYQEKKRYLSRDGMPGGLNYFIFLTILLNQFKICWKKEKSVAALLDIERVYLSEFV